MRLTIRSQLVFEYDAPVCESQNELRACPAGDDHQHLVSYQVSIEPHARVASSIDYWGTRVDAFGIRAAHERMAVEASATVETRPRPIVAVSPDLSTLHDPRWRDSHVEYLERTPHTSWGARIREASARLLSETNDVVSLTLAVHRLAHGHLAYRTGATEIGADVEDVFVQREGVCQDYAHLAIALCRAAGVPARYVQGYFFTVDERSGAAPAMDLVADPTGDGDVVEVATHAWFEAAIPGHGWLALDPTNATSVGERHVVVGRGRDYDDVPPIRGVFAGGAMTTVDASVEMRRHPPHLSGTAGHHPQVHNRGQTQNRNEAQVQAQQ